MIYETAVVLRAHPTDETLNGLKTMVSEVIAQFKGELLITDDWGTRYFAQATARGAKQGHYVYFMYKSTGTVNTELERRFKISENVLKYLLTKLGEDHEVETITKSYGTPYSKVYTQTFESQTSAEEGEDMGMEYDVAKDRKMFLKRKNCWFTARKTRADWKDPSSYTWLLNEFGKISPARVTGLCAKQQRWATHTIKKARQIGLLSYLTNKVAQ